MLVVVHSFASFIAVLSSFLSVVRMWKRIFKFFHDSYFLMLSFIYAVPFSAYFLLLFFALNFREHETKIYVSWTLGCLVHKEFNERKKITVSFWLYFQQYRANVIPMLNQEKDQEEKKTWKIKFINIRENAHGIIIFRKRRLKSSSTLNTIMKK